MSNSNHEEARDAYLNWLLTPPGEREPSTKTDFAEKWDVSRSILYHWENSATFQEAMRQLKGKWGARWHGDILGRLMSIVQSGRDGDAIRAASVLLKHLDIGGEKSDDEALSEEQESALAAWLEEKGFSTINSSNE